MKCKHCDGKGYAYVRTAPNPITGCGYKRICDYCHGTGEIKQTEQEWLQTCSTEELAEWLLEHMECIGCPANQEKCHRQYDICKETIMEWLKRPHKNKE